MSCARCNSGVYDNEEFITMNKLWHKNCFTCCRCNKTLNKSTAKIFQGELFCECCYSCVIERLFEVISSPSLHNLCKVASSPSCVRTTKEKNSNNSSETYFSRSKSINKSQEVFYYCPLANVKSFTCITSASNTKCHLIYPIPREVANYLNRSHMKNKSCQDPCCPSQKQQPPPCSNCCRKPCSCRAAEKCRIRILPYECCCNCSTSTCRPSSPQRCCQKLCPDCCNKCCPPSKPLCPPPCLPKSCSPQRCCCNKNSPSPPPSPPKCSCCLPVTCCPASPPSYQPVMQRCCEKTAKCCCCNKIEEPTCKCCPPSTKYCPCGRINPCNCKISQIRSQCTSCCVRCGQRVYAAEKIQVACGAFHMNCFTCYNCHKCLDVKNVSEGCGEIYCKQCYNNCFGIDYYGFGSRGC